MNYILSSHMLCRIKGQRNLISVTFTGHGKTLRDALQDYTYSVVAFMQIHPDADLFYEK